MPLGRNKIRDPPCNLFHESLPACLHLECFCKEKAKSPTNVRECRTLERRIWEGDTIRGKMVNGKNGKPDSFCLK